MTGVVLRCPSCGTAQATVGECDVCHEAQVRPYCTNHTPGLWLETQACPRCGARFGETRPRPPAPAATPRPVPSPAEPPPRRETPSPARTRGPWSRGRLPTSTEAPSEDGAAIGRGAPSRGWPDRLRPSPRARRSLDVRGEETGGAPVRAALGGCRLVLFLGLFLVFLFMTMALLAGGPFLQILLSAMLSR